MLNSDPEVPWADSCKKHDIGGVFLNAEVRQKSQNGKSMIFKKKINVLAPARGERGLRGYPRGFTY